MGKRAPTAIADVALAGTLIALVALIGAAPASAAKLYRFGAAAGESGPLRLMTPAECAERRMTHRQCLNENARLRRAYARRVAEDEARQRVADDAHRRHLAHVASANVLGRMLLQQECRLYGSARTRARDRYEREASRHDELISALVRAVQTAQVGTRTTKQRAQSSRASNDSSVGVGATQQSTSNATNMNETETSDQHLLVDVEARERRDALLVIYREAAHLARLKALLLQVC